jgi:CheY-like chemotaxis protein
MDRLPDFRLHRRGLADLGRPDDTARLRTSSPRRTKEKLFASLIPAGTCLNGSASWALCSLLDRRPGRFVGIRDRNHDLSSYRLPNRNLVLVVDDDASMLWSVARLLRQLGYASLPFSSAEAFANHSDLDRAVCVLLDINLGDGSGIELRHRLKAAGNTVPVIYMTGNDNPAVREAALQSGCLAYLTKPFSAKSLIEPLQRASAS